MNKTHTLIWSDARQTWVVAHEGASVRGKPASRRKGAAGAVLAAALLAQAALAQAPAPGALPTGGQVAAGQASISQAGSTLTIQQGTDRAILNWQSFNIGSQAAVNFQQPSASAVALNRVLGSDPSAIYGALTANGQVFLVNPSGVLFGQGARVDVGGLVASTLAIRDQDFLGGHYRFSRDGATAGVINQGQLYGKYIALLAPEVRNEGVIATRMGTTALAAGETVTLGVSGNHLIDVQVEQASINTLVENKHLVQAEAGTVVLSAQSAHTLLGQVVNTGAIEAQGLVNDGGTVRLLASSSIQHSGSIAADAGVNGQGGSAILLASLDNPNSQTMVSGSISAKGGSSSGDGGFVETSGTHLKIADTVKIDTTASQGKTGTWLLDPYDFTIAATNGDITGSALSAALSSSDVTIQTSDTAASCTGLTGCGTGNSSGNGDIFVNDSVTWSSNKILTLNAWRDINVNAPISVNGAGALALKFAQAGTPDDAGPPVLGTYVVRAPINLSPNASFSTTYLRDGPTTPTTTLSYTVVVASADKVPGKSVGLEDVTATGNYVLGANLDTTTTPTLGNWTPIGNDTTAFDGLFDGLGHTITGLTVSGTGANNSNVGLFGVLRPTTDMMTFVSTPGLIQNLGLIDANVAGLANVGALVGKNDGGINNSYATSSGPGTSVVTGRDAVGSSTDEVVSGIGGLVGYNTGGINGSYANVTVTATTGDQTTPDMLGVAGGVGGLVGAHISGAITGSYAAGSVTGLNAVGGFAGHVASSTAGNYSRGLVAGTTNVGGFIGKFDNPMGMPGFLAANFWDTTTSNQSTSAGQLADEVTGMTSAQMLVANNFKQATTDNGATLAPGWQNSGAWELRDGSYPLLKELLKPLFVYANNQTTTYNGAVVSSFGTTVSGGPGAAYSGSPTATASGSPTNVGTYTLTSSGLTLSAPDDQQGYRLEYVNGTLTINPRQISLTAGSNAAGTRSYGDSTNPTVSYTVGGDGMANAEDAQTLLGFTIGSAANGSTSVGSYSSGPNAYKISSTSVGLHGNYNVTAINDGTLTIDPRQITLTAGSNAAGTRIEGAATNPTVGYTVGGAGMANAEDAQALLGFTVGSAADSSTPVGSYSSGPNAYRVSGTSVGVNGNYNVTAINDGTLTVSAPGNTELDNAVAIIQGSLNTSGTTGKQAAGGTATQGIAPISTPGTTVLLGGQTKDQAVATTAAAEIAAENTKARTTAAAQAAADAKRAADAAAADPGSTQKAIVAQTAQRKAEEAKVAADKAVADQVVAEKIAAEAKAMAAAPTLQPKDRSETINKIAQAIKAKVEAFTFGWGFMFANTSKMTEAEKNNLEVKKKSIEAAHSKAEEFLKGVDPETVKQVTALVQAQSDVDQAAADAKAAAKTAADARAAAKAAADKAAASRAAADKAAAEAEADPGSNEKAMAAGNAALQAAKDKLASREAEMTATDAETEATNKAAVGTTAQLKVKATQVKVTAHLSEQEKAAADKTASEKAAALGAATFNAALTGALSGMVQGGASASAVAAEKATEGVKRSADKVEAAKTAAANAQAVADQAAANARAAAADAPKKAAIIAQLEHLQGLLASLGKAQAKNRVQGQHVGAVNAAYQAVSNALRNKDASDLATLQKQLDSVKAAAANGLAPKAEHDSYNNATFDKDKFRVDRDSDRAYLDTSFALEKGLRPIDLNKIGSDAALDAAKTEAAQAAAKAAEARAQAKAAEAQAAVAQAEADAATQNAMDAESSKKAAALQVLAKNLAAAAVAAQATAQQAAAAKAAADAELETAAADSAAANLAVKKEEAALAANAKANAQRELAAAQAAVAQKAEFAKEAAKDAEAAKATADKAQVTAAQAKAAATQAETDKAKWEKTAADKAAEIPLAAKAAEADRAAFDAAKAKLDASRDAADKALAEANTATEEANKLAQEAADANAEFLEAAQAAGESAQDTITLLSNALKGETPISLINKMNEAKDAAAKARNAYNEAKANAEVKRAAFTAAQGVEDGSLKAVNAAADKANKSATAAEQAKLDKQAADQNVASLTKYAKETAGYAKATADYANATTRYAVEVELDAQRVAAATEAAKDGIKDMATKASDAAAAADRADAAVKAAQG